MELIEVETLNPVEAIESIYTTPHELCIVIPTFNSKNHIKDTVTLLLKELSHLAISFQILIIDDGSQEPLRLDYRELASLDKHITICLLARNYGQHFSTLLGINMSINAHNTLTIDDDNYLEHQQIKYLLDQMEDHDLVVYSPLSRQSSWKRYFISRLIARIVKNVSGQFQTIPLGSTRMISSILREELSAPVGDEFVSVELLRRSVRPAGVKVNVPSSSDRTSTYKLRALVSLTAKLLFSYSTYMLKLATIFSLMVTTILTLLPLAYLTLKLRGSTPPAGWITTLTIVSSGFALNFLVLSILAIYVGSIIKFNRLNRNYTRINIRSKIVRGK